jgi:L-2,4-diaminobutyrate decarboxylase
MSDSETCLISQAYSSELFSAAAGHWKSLLTEHLQRLQAGNSKVLNWVPPDESIASAAQWMNAALAKQSDGPAEGVRKLFAQMLASGQNLHHPHYIGHQVPAAVPLAGLFDAVSSVTNQVMAIYEMGPWATAVEYALLGALCRKVGWNDQHSSGLLTHGGSLANLTALLTARNVSIADSWKTGIPSGTTLVTNADVHYCVTRTAGILGLGAQNVARVPLDGRRRMDVAALERTLTELRTSGRAVIAVSACAGSTPTGAFDDLKGISEVCRRHGVWLHVDAAHGGALLFSRKHRHKLEGIAEADSIVWDAHKMLFVPALCTAVLYRNKAHRFETFQQDAPYLFDPSAPGMADIDSGMRTVECTKRATGFGLWGLWCLFGEELFEQLVDHTLGMTRHLYQLLLAETDFQTLHEPECNILAFRYLPPELRTASLERQNAFQREVRTRLIRSGEFYIVQTTLDGMAALRITVMNPLTTTRDLQELLDSLKRTGQQVLGH